MNFDERIVCKCWACGNRRVGRKVSYVITAMLCAAIAGCWITKPPVMPPASYVDCAENGVKSAATRLLPAVEAALQSADYEAALAAIIAVAGPLAVDEVACAVQLAIAEATPQIGYTALPMDAEVQNGKAWLAAHSVVFK